MKQIFITGLITLAVGLVVAYFTHNLNKEYVDLRYTLSEKIPTKFRETSPSESVQQLVVKNNGNLPAMQIQIKINGFITDYDMLKNAISDVVTEHKSKNHFEVVYPSLPPDGQFVFVFKTQGGGISSRDIEIKHNKGKALEALSGDRRSLLWDIISYLPVSLIIFYFIMIGFQIRSMAISHIEAKGSYTNYYDYLNRKKPLYITQEKWDSIRREYIKEQIRAKSFSLYGAKIEGWDSYKILNSDKPKFVSDDEWELLKEKAAKSLEEELSYIIKATSTYDSLSSLETFFTVQRPKNMLESKWQEIIKKINDNYVIIRKRKATRLSLNELLKEFEKGPPQGILPDFWDDYTKHLKSLFYNLVYSSVLNRVILFEHLKDIDLNVLGKDKIKKIEDTAYTMRILSIAEITTWLEAEMFIKKEKPEWIRKNDLDKIVEKAQSYITLDKAVKKNNALLSCLNDIIKLIPLNKKPDSLDSVDWDELRKIESQIVVASQKIVTDNAAIEAEKSKTNMLKDKVLKQLAIIDHIFSDPESINKIEDYDNPFSPGNFSNLKRFADQMLKQRETT